MFFCKVEGLIGASTCMLWASRSAEVSSQISEWTKEKDLLFITSIVKNVTESKYHKLLCNGAARKIVNLTIIFFSFSDPQYYLHTCGGLGFLYSFTCVLLIIGAFAVSFTCQLAP